jgi:hypothetical protein
LIVQQNSLPSAVGCWDRSVVNKQVKPAFGQLCIRVVPPGVVSRAPAVIAKSSGPGAAKTVRACLSGKFALTIQDGAVAVIPVRSATAEISSGKRAPRAPTAAETGRLVELFRARGCATELPDIVDRPPATGHRLPGSARRWPCATGPTATASRFSISGRGPGR